MKAYSWAETLSTLAGLAGTTLAHYLGLAGLRGWRREGNRGECAFDPAHDTRPDPPSDQWCPGHDTWFPGGEAECPLCRDEWEQRWTLTEDDQRAMDDWADGQEERARQDDWYLSLCERAARPGEGRSDL